MKAKKVLIALLSLSSAAVWGPQIYQGVAASSEPEIEYPGPDEASALASGQAESSDLEAPTVPSLSAARVPSTDSSEARDLPAAPASTAGEVVPAEGQGQDHQLDQLLSVLGIFGGNDPGGLQSMMAEPPSWLSQQVPAVDDSGQAGSLGLGSEPGGGAAPGARWDSADEIEDFVAGTPLTAIVRSSSDSWALIGGRIVREGDVLLPGLLRVRSIRDDLVVLATPDGELEVPLPPFRVQQSSVDSEPGSGADGMGDPSTSSFEDAQQAPASNQS